MTEKRKKDKMSYQHLLLQKVYSELGNLMLSIIESKLTFRE